MPTILFVNGWRVFLDRENFKVEDAYASNMSGKTSGI